MTKIGAVLIFDGHGRVFQVHDAKISHGTFSPTYPARTAVIALMDRLGTADMAYQPGAFQD